MKMSTPSCKRYTGYRPCVSYKVCDGLSKDCLSFDAQWLLIDLSAEADLLRDSEAMRLLEKEHSQIHVVAVVLEETAELYKRHPHVDLVLPYDFESVSILNVMRFDRILTSKKDPKGQELEALVKKAPQERFILKNGCLDLGKNEEKRVSMIEKAPARILIVNLDALGDVLMTTALLPVLKREWPGSTIDWVTVPYAVNVLKGNSMINRILPYNEETVENLPGEAYDVMISVDKGRRSCALAELVPCPDKRGYGLNEKGHITYFNEEAEYAYRLGIDDYEKFRVNKKTGQQLLAESVGLEWKRDPYALILTDEERAFVKAYRASLGITERTPAIAFNTGCSDIYPNKKMTIDQHVELIGMIERSIPKAKILLVGGKQETEQNHEIAERCKEAGVRLPVIETPTTEGLRKGILYVDACDAMVTGDTSALHIGVALRKFIVSWYGVSCWNEIDLYENGVKFFHEDLDCSPCWKKSCVNVNPKTNLPECVARLDLEAMARALKEWSEKRKK